MTDRMLVYQDIWFVSQTSSQVVKHFADVGSAERGFEGYIREVKEGTSLQRSTALKLRCIIEKLY